jgi:lambda family phage portal protein
MDKSWQWSTLQAFGRNTGVRRAWLVKGKERPGQKRGISILAAILEILKQLDRYIESELVAANNQGNQALIIKTASGQYSLPGTGNETATEEEDDEIILEPGAVISLAEGEEAEAFNPTRPNSQFEPFIISLMKMIGAGTGLPLEFLMQFFQSSYSAARGAFMLAWKTIEMHAKHLNDHFNQPVFELFVDELVARGMIDLFGLDYSDWHVRKAVTRADWDGPPQGTIDPVKEINAQKTAIELGVETRQRVAQKRGNGDIVDITRQLGNEKQIRDEQGLIDESPQVNVTGTPEEIQQIVRDTVEEEE